MQNPNEAELQLPNPIQLIECATGTSDRTGRDLKNEGITGTFATIEGKPMVVVSIFAEGAEITTAALLDHDELCQVLDMLNDLHDIICTAKHKGTIQ